MYIDMPDQQMEEQRCIPMGVCLHPRAWIYVTKRNRMRITVVVAIYVILDKQCISITLYKSRPVGEVYMTKKQT